MLRSCVCVSYDRQRKYLVVESAAFRKRPSSGTTRDPVRRRAADCFRSPGTFYHAMTVIAYISVISPLDGGGLYALRAGRCGCDSLSLASSRQRVKSLRSSVRLRLGHILLARSSPEVCCTPLTLRSAHIFRGLAEQRDCDFRSYVRSSHRRSSRRLAQRKILVSGLAIPAFARAFVFRLRGFRGAAGA